MRFPQLDGLREFAGAFVSLVCYSRVGPYNMLYAGGINLSMILFVFGFPFLNPYLRTFIYFGPLCTTDDYPALLVSWSVAVATQIAGAGTAGLMHNHLVENFGIERLNATYAFARDTAPMSTYIADEMFAVLFLLVGLLHLIRAMAEPLLANRYWAGDTQDPPSSSSRDALSIQLIACASFLVIAITHAFPSANQSLHITVYLSVIGVQSSDESAYRSLGGVLGTLLALLYYYVYYNNEICSNGYNQIHTEDSSSSGTSKRNVVDGPGNDTLPTPKQSSYRESPIIPESSRPLPARQPSSRRNTGDITSNKSGSKRTIDTVPGNSDNDDDMDNITDRNNTSGDTKGSATTSLPPKKWSDLKPLPMPKTIQTPFNPPAQSRLGYKFTPHFT